MEVVQHPYETPDGKGVTENQRDSGSLGLGGLEQGDQFEGLDNFGVVCLIIIVGRESPCIGSTRGFFGLPTGERNPKPGTAYDNRVCEAIRELAGFARIHPRACPGVMFISKRRDSCSGMTVTKMYGDYI